MNFSHEQKFKDRLEAEVRKRFMQQQKKKQRKGQTSIMD